MMSFETHSMLEDLHFKYERLYSLISCLQSLIAEGRGVEVKGLPEHALDFSLYEIEMELRKSNETFGEILENVKFVREAAS